MPLAADIGALADGRNHEAGKHHCLQNNLQLSAKKPIVALVHGGRVHLSIPVRDFASHHRLAVVRSFDVNTHGAEIDEVKCGVAGGSVLIDVLRTRARS
ncbi:uncharacterized protein F5891DRAFT_1194203 [Suillus fuscotomentosus]|uniref:Uncharacterized protein n=1 Tax=Suillus fuscotomentosus TaxID=1912939 RepID=A0AAD4DZH7_9AGAM|nr:uncharacterized protein F5891DRAFT_1194203 [Suillus fuscotomentosus]KAG1895488.1 hypothetical protein F5891DRAFT_1194203 [Suillus fuscotomentosus]